MTTEDRAARLLRWYPASWRARYGAEFTELLIADLAERPRCRCRTADLAFNALLARLRCAGLSGQLLDPADQARACLAVLAGAATLFLTLGTMAWSQLITGWQWAPPGARATRAAVVIMSAGLLLMLVLAVLAIAPACWSLGRAAVRHWGGRTGGPAPRWAWPAALAALGGMVLGAGARHFANGWPGTGGHPWPQQGLVPGGAAAFGWAATLSVTSYWAHPDALLAFPGRRDRLDGDQPRRPLLPDRRPGGHGPPAGRGRPGTALSGSSRLHGGWRHGPVPGRGGLLGRAVTLDPAPCSAPDPSTWPPWPGWRSPWRPPCSRRTGRGPPRWPGARRRHGGER